MLMLMVLFVLGGLLNLRSQSHLRATLEFCTQRLNWILMQSGVHVAQHECVHVRDSGMHILSAFYALKELVLLIQQHDIFWKKSRRKKH